MNDKLYYSKSELIADRKLKYPNESGSELEHNALAFVCSKMELDCEEAVEKFERFLGETK